MGTLEIILQITGLITLLLGFAEHLGEARLRGFELAVKEHLTWRKSILLPRVVFAKSTYALTWNEGIATVVILAFIGFVVSEPSLDQVKERYLDLVVWSGEPVRWFNGIAGPVGEIISAPLAILMAAVFGLLLPMLVLLLLVTLLALMVLYPLLGLLAVATYCKKTFNLTGPVIKIAAYGLSVALYVVSLGLNILHP